MTSKLIAKLRKSKEYRDAFVASQINIGIPFQIRALRKQPDRNWDQKRLAEEAGMLQPRISAMEQPGYGNFTLDTLKRLASAFDIALIVRFAPFSALIGWSEQFSPDSFQIPSFEKELEHITALNRDNIIAFNCLSMDTTTASSLTESRQDPSGLLKGDEIMLGLQTIVAGGG